jgi:DNA-binding MarR family transcriptional regulator
MGEEQIGAVIERVIDPTVRPQPTRQASSDFWRDLNEELKAAKTPEEKDAVWRRYAEAQGNPKPNRRQRRRSTLDPVKYRRLTREQRARLIFLAERFDAHSREPGKHGGCLKRTGLQVLRILLFHFHNVHNGRCDPSLDTIAKAAGMARSTVAKALNRLEAAGIIERIRRVRWVRRDGRKRCEQWSNAYLLNVPKQYRKEEGDYANSAKSSKSGKQPETTAAEIKNLPPLPENVAAALARLGNTMANRFEREMKRHEDRLS